MLYICLTFTSITVQQLPSCGKSVTLTRTSNLASLHHGGSRNPATLAASVQLGGPTAGRCLIFLDDVVTTGNTFASIAIDLKRLDKTDAPNSVIFLAITKTCSNTEKHKVPAGCFACST